MSEWHNGAGIVRPLLWNWRHPRHRKKGLYAVNIRMMRLPDVVQATGLGRSTIYAKVAAGDFPAPVKLGTRAIAWPEAVVAEWLANRPSARAA